MLCSKRSRSYAGSLGKAHITDFLKSRCVCVYDVPSVREVCVLRVW